MIAIIQACAGLLDRISREGRPIYLVHFGDVTIAGWNTVGRVGVGRGACNRLRAPAGPAFCVPGADPTDLPGENM